MEWKQEEGGRGGRKETERRERERERERGSGERQGGEGVKERKRGAERGVWTKEDKEEKKRKR